MAANNRHKFLCLCNGNDVTDIIYFGSVTVMKKPLFDAQYSNKCLPMVITHNIFYKHKTSKLWPFNCLIFLKPHTNAPNASTSTDTTRF